MSSFSHSTFAESFRIRTRGRIGCWTQRQQKLLMKEIASKHAKPCEGGDEREVGRASIIQQWEVAYRKHCSSGSTDERNGSGVWKVIPSKITRQSEEAVKRSNPLLVYAECGQDRVEPESARGGPSAGQGDPTARLAPPPAEKSDQTYFDRNWTTELLFGMPVDAEWTRGLNEASEGNHQKSTSTAEQGAERQSRVEEAESPEYPTEEKHRRRERKWSNSSIAKAYTAVQQRRNTAGERMKLIGLQQLITECGITRNHHAVESKRSAPLLLDSEWTWRWNEAPKRNRLRTSSVGVESPGFQKLTFNSGRG
jgi:hypothetical protein